MKHLNHSVIATAMLLALAPAALATNGYMAHGSGATNDALAGAGVAEPQDAMAAEVNPAGIAMLGNEIYGSLAVFSPHREFTVTGNPSGYPGTFGLRPGTVRSEEEMFLMPSIGWVHSINDRNTFGLTMVARGGMDTDYHSAVFHGSEPTGVDLMQGVVNVTWAYKIRPNHSIGASAVLVYQRFEAEGMEAFGQMSSDPTRLSNNGYDSGSGIGVKIGYLGNLSPYFSVGASYAPKLSMSEFDKYSGLFAEQGGFDIPENYQAGLSFHPNEKLKLLFDIQQINYSGVSSIGNPLLPNLMQAPLGSDSGAGFGWRDMTIYKLGVQYQPAGSTWIWRAGYSNGKQPIPESEVLFNIVAPGVIEDHITAGFSKQVSGRNQLHVALMYALSNTVTGPNPLEAPGQQTIELKMDEWQVELGYSYRF